MITTPIRKMYKITWYDNVQKKNFKSEIFAFDYATMIKDFKEKFPHCTLNHVVPVKFEIQNKPLTVKK